MDRMGNKILKPKTKHCCSCPLQYNCVSDVNLVPDMKSKLHLKSELYFSCHSNRLVEGFILNCLQGEFSSFRCLFLADFTLTGKSYIAFHVGDKLWPFSSIPKVTIS